MGYRNVHVMSAGITGWINAALPTESGEKVEHKPAHD
jgi:3-mercaptopyruvate sulfurtransferase SseA